MAKELLLPGMLANGAARIRAEITYAKLLENPPTDMLFSTEKIDASLAQFCQGISGRDLNNFMRSFAKEDYSRSDNFSLKPISQKGPETVEKDRMGRFYFDGDYGLALGVDSHLVKGDKLWVAVSSFCVGNGIDEYNPNENSPLKGTMPYPYPHPVIVQIQGPSVKNYDSTEYGRKSNYGLHQEAISVLKHYKWERAMVSLILQWASQSQIHTVYLLPAEKSRWLEKYCKCREDKGQSCSHCDEIKARKPKLEMRYDVSAKRLGFKLQPNGLYATSVV